MDDEFEDEQILDHITSETLLVRCFLEDDAFTGEWISLKPAAYFPFSRNI